MESAFAYWIIAGVGALVIGFAGVVAAKIWLRHRAKNQD
jgi:Flp pilus assembly protein CpaB